MAQSRAAALTRSSLMAPHGNALLLLAPASHGPGCIWHHPDCRVCGADYPTVHRAAGRGSGMHWFTSTKWPPHGWRSSLPCRTPLRAACHLSFCQPSFTSASLGSHAGQSSRSWTTFPWTCSSSQPGMCPTCGACQSSGLPAITAPASCQACCSTAPTTTTRQGSVAEGACGLAVTCMRRAQPGLPLLGCKPEGLAHSTQSVSMCNVCTQHADLPTSCFNTAVQPFPQSSSCCAPRSRASAEMQPSGAVKCEDR